MIEVILVNFSYVKGETDVQVLLQEYANRSGYVHNNVRSVKFEGSTCVFSITVISRKGNHIQTNNFFSRGEMINYVRGYVDGIADGVEIGEC